MPAAGTGVGIVRPKLQYRVPGTETRIGVQTAVLAFFSTALRGGGRVMRPLTFVAGYF